MEWIFALLFSWPTLALFAIIAILTDHNERAGWSFIFTLAFGLVVYKVFDLTWQEALIVVGAYIPVGIVWSIFRYKRHCNTVVEQARLGKINRADAKRKVELSNSMENIVYWATAWPFSFLSSIFGDFIDLMHSLVRNLFGKTFAKISQAAQGQIDKI